MEVIKRTISFEPATVRYTGGTSPYGTMTADTFYINVMLTQNIDDMGMYTDMSFISGSTLPSEQPDYTTLINKLIGSGLTFPFMYGIQPPTPTGPIDNTNIRLTGDSLSDYWVYASRITGFTDSKKTDVKGYSNTQPFQTGFDINKTIYTNYIGNTIDGRTRITYQSLPSLSAVTYVFDANNDVNIGTVNQNSGILYTDYSGLTRQVTDSLGNKIATPLTTMQYDGEGWNQTNTSLSAQTKEEYLFGITQPPEVQSDVFIDRGGITVLEKHLRLSEIESLEHLERYNNGFYKIVTQ
jgi:hypothetical protein